MWEQKIEYVDAEIVLPPPVKKQVWDGEKFVSITLHKRRGTPDSYQMQWLNVTFGFPGTYKSGQFWDYSKAGNFTVMDEKVFMWYQTKWGNK